jgi:hypothetical protein
MSDQDWHNSYHFGVKAWERGLTTNETVDLEKVHNPDRRPYLYRAFWEGYHRAAETYLG